MKRTLVTFFVIMSTVTAPLLGQGVVGTWKRTAMLLTDASGKTEDELPGLTKTMPCTAGITYSFLADGTMRTDVPESCGPMKKTIERMNKAGRWSATGTTIKIVIPDKSLPDSEYTLTMSGNTMSWTFDYASSPQMPNPEKAKRLVIKYARL